MTAAAELCSRQPFSYGESSSSEIKRLDNYKIILTNLYKQIYNCSID